MDPRPRSSIEVRRLSEDDLAAVIVGLSSRAPEIHRKRLADQARGGFINLVAWLDGRPVGFVGLALHADASTAEMCEARGWALVEDLFVEEPFRRLGAGRELMVGLESEARAVGMPGIILDTGTNEYFAPARALYRSLGYADQAGVYLGGWSDPHHPGVHYVDQLTQWRKPL
jgi:GNAT superfamily N-acetyltransferase